MDVGGFLSGLFVVGGDVGVGGGLGRIRLCPRL